MHLLFTDKPALTHCLSFVNYTAYVLARNKTHKSNKIKFKGSLSDKKDLSSVASNLLQY